MPQVLGRAPAKARPPLSLDLQHRAVCLALQVCVASDDHEVQLGSWSMAKELGYPIPSSFVIADFDAVSVQPTRGAPRPAKCSCPGACAQSVPLYLLRVPATEPCLPLICCHWVLQLQAAVASETCGHEFHNCQMLAETLHRLRTHLHDLHVSLLPALWSKSNSGCNCLFTVSDINLNIAASAG